MSAEIIDGKSVANQLLNIIKHKIKLLHDRHNLVPGLAVLSVGEDPASSIYIRNKIKISNLIGINCFEFKFPEEVLENHIIKKIENLNNDPKIHGILVQLPLPKSINKYNIINAVNPDKDVDGFHWQNIGKLVTGQKCLSPATAVGCLKLIKTIKQNLAGLKATVIGRSDIVGKPVAALLLNENCTVTILHTKSINIEDEIKKSDIIVAAIGHPNFVKKEWIKEGAIVIDVGINRLEPLINANSKRKLTGDVDFEQVKEVAGYITPVPGGVGPMTIACLLDNTLIAACMSKNIDYDSL